MISSHLVEASLKIIEIHRGAVFEIIHLIALLHRLRGHLGDPGYILCERCFLLHMTPTHHEICFVCFHLDFFELKSLNVSWSVWMCCRRMDNFTRAWLATILQPKD